jgi:hypothetical protein
MQRKRIGQAHPLPPEGYVTIQKSVQFLLVMPDLIRHPTSEQSEKTLDSLRGEFI